MPFYDAALVYAGPDLPIVDHIAQVLKRKGLRVWFDRLMKPDENFSAEMIREVFSNSHFVVPLMSPHAERSAWVNAELQLAFEMKARVLPCVIGELGDKRDDDTAALQQLRTLNFIDLRPTGETISEERVEELAAMLLMSDRRLATRQASMRHTSATRFIPPVLAFLVASLLFIGWRRSRPGPATHAVDLFPAVAFAANALVLLGGFICLIAVFLWGLRHLLEAVAARRAWRRVRSILSNPMDTGSP